MFPGIFLLHAFFRNPVELIYPFFTPVKIGVFQQYQEFIAANTVHRAVHKHFAHRVAAIHQIFIAVIVPVSIVDYLQIINIQHKQRVLCFPNPHLPLKTFFGLFQGVLVLHMGQRIAVRLVLHARNILLQALHGNSKASCQPSHFIISRFGQLHIQLTLRNLFGSFGQLLQRLGNAA